MFRNRAIPHGQVKARLQYALGDIHDGPPSQRIMGHSIAQCEAPRRSKSPDHLTGRLLAVRVTALVSGFWSLQTSVVAAHMSAFGGKADMTSCANPLLRSLLGEKRTSLFAAHMSAFDPKRTSARPCRAVTVLGGCRENFGRAICNSRRRSPGCRPL